MRGRSSGSQNKFPSSVSHSVAPSTPERSGSRHIFFSSFCEVGHFECEVLCFFSFLSFPPEVLWLKSYGRRVCTRDYGIIEGEE